METPKTKEGTKRKKEASSTQRPAKRTKTASTATKTPKTKPTPSSSTSILPPTTTATILEHQVKPSEDVYSEEISKMMYTFGDVREPLRESVKLVESFVRKYMTDLIFLTAKRVAQNSLNNSVDKMVSLMEGTSPTDVAHIVSLSNASSLASNAQSKPMKIEINDLLFNFRKDPAKVNRIKKSLKFSVRHNNFNKEDLVPKGAKRKRTKLEQQNAIQKSLCRKYDHILSLAEFSDEDLEEETTAEKTAGELEEEKKRLKAADQVTKKMPTEEYIDYAKCREASFTHNSTKRFKEWLKLGDLAKEDKVQVPDRLLDCLGYIAWETVGIITQIALVAKRNMHMAPVHDEREENFGVATGVMTPQTRDILSTVSEDQLKKNTSIPSSIANQAKAPLEPVHLQEAIRRLCESQQSIFGVCERTTQKALQTLPHSD